VWNQKEELEFPICKHEIGFFENGKYNDSSVSQWENSDIYHY
jgi:hypothetical protein